MLIAMNETLVIPDDLAACQALLVRFAQTISEQNRTIHIPLIGDRNVEGPENFYVHVAPGDAEADLEKSEQLEVVLNDDD